MNNIKVLTEIPADIQNANIIRLLEGSQNIAVVGLSPKSVRPSNVVANYLIQAGYTVIPVNPGHDSLLGEPCYPDLRAIPVTVDIVNIFRKSSYVPQIVEQAIAIGCQAIWMQQGISHPEAAALARQNDLEVYMDRCIKIDHSNLIPKHQSQL